MGEVSIDEGHRVEVGLRFGVACCLDAGSLDPRSDHALAKEWTSSQEELVVVSSPVVSRGETGEAIEIELSLEGGQFALSKIDRHNVAYKHLWLVYNKAASVGLPRDNVSLSVFFRTDEHFMESLGERGRDTSPRTTTARFDWVLHDRKDVVWSFHGMIVVIVSNKVSLVRLCGLTGSKRSAHWSALGRLADSNLLLLLLLLMMLKTLWSWIRCGADHLQQWVLLGIAVGMKVGINIRKDVRHYAGWVEST